MVEIDILRGRLARAEQSRLAAEQIIEEKSRELYEKNHQLVTISREFAKYLRAQVCEAIITGHAPGGIGAARKFLTVMFSDLRAHSVRTVPFPD